MIPRSSLPRRVAGAAATALVLTAFAPGPRAEAGPRGDTAAPACVHTYPGWRYTTVVNDCDTVVHVTVDYADGRSVPCRTLAPHDIATFPGYGPELDHVTGTRECVPGTARAAGPARLTG
ncbi:alpha-amylase [Streptomyces sp. NPDC046831]|uniref:alpha-amylase n=1 Tax=Streptomyces sp. NPDC046831 TaxID=3154805 RepID=UPI0033F4D009